MKKKLCVICNAPLNKQAKHKAHDDCFDMFDNHDDFTAFVRKKKAYGKLRGFTKMDVFCYPGSCEDFKENSRRFFAQYALDVYGSAVRDNTLEELVLIGKELSKGGIDEKI